MNDYAQLALGLEGTAERLRRKAEALHELGRPAEALKLVFEGLGHEPDSEDLLTLGARLSLVTEKYDQAADLARQAVRAAPYWSYPLALLARICRLREDYAGASQAAQRALALYPDDGLAHFELGMVNLIDAEQAQLGRRKALLRQARTSASEVERVWSTEPEGPALHALISLVEKQWERHQQEIARALARDPNDDFSQHVRLLGLSERRERQLIPELYHRLRSHPDDNEAREKLRAQFGLAVWFRTYWGFSWWIWAVLILTRLAGIVILSLPLYLVWRWKRIRQYGEAYLAAFLPAERRQQVHRQLFLLVPALLLLSALLHAVWPPGWESRVQKGIVVLSCLAVAAYSLPAAVSGRGGLFGPVPELPRAAYQRSQPLRPSQVASAALLGLATLLSLGRFAQAALAARSSQEPYTESLGSLGSLLLIALAFGLVTLRSVYTARYGKESQLPISAMDLLLCCAALLTAVMLLMA